MAEEFQGGVCGGNWWNPPRYFFASSPCASAINDTGSFGWLQNHDLMMDVSTARTSISDDSAGSASDGVTSVLIQDAQKPQQPAGDGNMSMFADDWNQDLLHDHSGRSEEDYSRMLQEAAGLNYQQTTTDSDKNFCEDSSINSFKQVINQSFPLEQQPSNSLTSSTECLPLMNSASYSFSTSSLLQTLFDTDSDQPQQSLLENQTTNYSSYPNHRMNSTELLPSLTTAKPSLTKQQPANHLPFCNNTTFWDAMAAASGASVLPSTQPRILPPPINSGKSNLPHFTAKHHNEEDKKKFSNEPAFKRPRIETPSPLPTFKVRKEKLGDRITALQQLVSPFGKTDTASVLHEAIEYIKFLHDQVSVLSTPYLKNASPPLQRQQADDKNKDQEGPIQDLKSRGLCLVPISSTFPVAAETTADFWTPTFGGSFR
ncbi:Transcription factor [Sesamum alatum]|uniref:Transcription factor n=1 Tax=Sesamum alatum TaxID=300844 RepID=A0AAE1Y080_9LAMI|nr:Transcription factor [Sesamum alatum]